MASGDPMFSGETAFVPLSCLRATEPGGGTPVEPWKVWAFPKPAASNLFVQGVLSPKYTNLGLTLRLWWFSSVVAGSVVWRARFRRNNVAANSIKGSHDYFAAGQTVTTAAGGTVFFPVLSVMTFSNGGQIESLAAGEPFALMIGRNSTAGGDNHAATALLRAVELVET